MKRHLLTGPAEIEFDAARGILTVVPAASFEAFKLELDMLELPDQPRLDGLRIQEQLEELDIDAWDADRVGAILREIANRAKGNAQVDEKNFEPSQTADTTFCVYLAPALVLRERRPTAFEEIVGRLLDQVANDSPTRTTGPWERFLDEGESSHVRGTHVSPAFSGSPGSTEPPGRLFFPLPTNAEQRQIVHRLRASPCVVVKGPPGTGKSHTIANLVSHLLASGERILIAAQAPKALTVLRDMLPEDLQDLCVTALGSSREDQRLLEEGVRGILRRQNEWLGTERVQAKIDELEKQLKALEAELTETERQLRESREAETHSHHLPGGYEGTAAQIARQLEQERETLEWFPVVQHDRSSFPLQEAEVCLLAAVHAELTTDLDHELRLDVGNFVLPTPDEFRHEERERLEREVLRSRRRPGEQPEPYESWFEVDVALELLRRNYRIHPQYEVAGKRNDLVVEGIENRLAVECDGDAWHGPEHYEQDMARQRQLERAGWTFVRVREAEFYSDRARVIDEIVQACGELSIRPVDQPQQVTQQGTSGEMEVEPVLPTEELASTDDAIEAQTDTLEDRPSTEQGPFTGYSAALGFPDPLDASPANVRAGLRKIIEKDGPISRASVYRLYVEGCPHRERATKVVRQALNHVLGTMLRSGEIAQEAELGDGSPEGQMLRLAEGPRVRERLAGRRDLQEIPPSELFVALERLDFGSTGTTLDEETLLRGLLEHYGYNRLTAIRRRYLSRVLELYRANREGSDSGDVAIERRT